MKPIVQPSPKLLRVCTQYLFCKKKAANIKKYFTLQMFWAKPSLLLCRCKGVFIFLFFNLAFAVVSSVCVYETVKLLFKPVVNSNTATSKQYNKLLLTSSSMKGSLLQGFVRIYIALFDEKKG